MVMRWIKTYEAAANEYRKKKLRTQKGQVNILLPSVKQVFNLVNPIIFDEEFNQFCDKYLIPRMETEYEKTNQRSIQLSGTEDKYTGTLNLRIEPRTDSVASNRRYGMNYAGMCRLANDYLTGKISNKLYDETTAFGGQLMVNTYDIDTKFGLLVQVKGLNTCELMFHYQLNWFSLVKIDTHSYEPKLVKENMTKQDVMEFIQAETIKFKEYLKSHISKFGLDFNDEKSLKNIHAILRILPKKMDYKRAEILRNYPVLIDKLGLDIKEVEAGANMKSRGFDD